MSDTATIATTIETTIEVPEKKYLDYLDGLRESGVTNMFGAPEYLQEAFFLDNKEAQEIFIYWMKNFRR